MRRQAVVTEGFRAELKGLIEILFSGAGGIAAQW